MSGDRLLVAVPGLVRNPLDDAHVRASGIQDWLRIDSDEHAKGDDGRQSDDFTAIQIDDRMVVQAGRLGRLLDVAENYSLHHRQ